MGYRSDTYHECRPGPNCVIPVDNGTIAYVTVPCYRINLDEPHDMMEHDHAGWPSPDSVDDSCQGPWDHGGMEEVDLNEAGYDSIVVSLLDPPSGLSVVGQIDGSKVEITISAMCESAVSDCLDVRFSVFAAGADEDDAQLRDLVIGGTIHVIANPISDSTYWVPQGSIDAYIAENDEWVDVPSDAFGGWDIEHFPIASSVKYNAYRKRVVGEVAVSYPTYPADKTVLSIRDPLYVPLGQAGCVGYYIKDGEVFSITAVQADHGEAFSMPDSDFDASVCGTGTMVHLLLDYSVE